MAGAPPDIVNKTDSERLLSTAQVSKLTGATPRQLQWWDEQNHLCPQRRPGPGGNGRRRSYSTAEVGRIRLYMKLRAKGIHAPARWAIVRRALPLEPGDHLVIPLPGDVVLRRPTAEAAAIAAAEWSGPVVVVRWD